MTTSTHFERHIYLYLVGAMVIWGVSWPSSKILTLYSDPLTLMFLKFSLSALSMVPLLYLFKKDRFFSFSILRPLAFATLAIIAYNIFFFYGLHYGLAGFGGIIVTGSNPIFTFLLVAFLEKISIPKHKKIALILGIIGTAIILNVTSFEVGLIFDRANLLFLLSSLSWSLVTIISSKAKQHINAIFFSLYLYLSSALVSYLFLVETTHLIAIFTYDLTFWFHLFFVTVITTGFATTIYFKASNILGASDTSSFIFLVPVVAVVSSYYLLDEVPSVMSLVGGTILILSVWLINKPA